MNRGKHILLSAGLLLGVMFTGPMMNNITTITAMAAETYSDNWFNEKEDLSGTWYYRMNDGSLCTSAWVHDNGQWYLLDASGNMLTGVVKSNGGKYYLLDTFRGTGTYGKMLTNGSVYNGVTISASVNADDEGSLSADTIAQLRSVGVNVDNVPNVENTKHVEGGVVVYANTSTPQPSTENPTTQSNGGTGEGGSTTSSTDDGFDTQNSGGSTDYSSWFDGLDPSGAGGVKPGDGNPYGSWK